MSGALPKLPSATQSSASVWFDHYNLINYAEERGELPAYELHDLTGLALSPGTGQQALLADIKAWLTRRLTLHAHDSILLDKTLVGTTANTSIWTNLCKRPDVQIVNSTCNQVMVQMGVESGKKEWSVNKLTLGLVDQLCWLRNHDTHITACTGFYIMKTTKGHVLRVTLTWQDNTFSFVQTLQRVQRASVLYTIQEVLREERQKLERALAQLEATPTLPTHAIPVSQSFLEEKFGQGAFQMSSGKSVVVINRQAKRVYKHCLDANETLTLLTAGGTPQTEQKCFSSGAPYRPS